MTQTEWIISLDDDLKDHDELFVGNVRDGETLIRCKDCKWFTGESHSCYSNGGTWFENEYCSAAEREEHE